MTDLPPVVPAGTPAVPESHADLADRPGVAALATVGKHGTPQVTAIWVIRDGGVFRTSLHPSRQKYRNILAHPKATLFWIDPANPFHTLEVRGTVTVEPDTDLVFLDKLLAHYGTDREHFKAPVDGRVVLTVTPTKVNTNG